ncbi:uncharacterized protein PITG_22711 [Phytophthora infestans T30-4]|uniref:Uncharacterized protein n=2 Tax=Phytophthora infestans TaxID=4787 RepID=D0MXN9_PHYIT|nr:uncharacterized protein PITG_22711 [Phytophthora infestans T30-4]EEY64402.1 conserved hypothetical protein [Phytophthora infestans T30-4]|eukprot:XP_002907838.1 conserved hypothetical protein [Phytophthora infestans T30-4]
MPMKMAVVQAVMAWTVIFNLLRLVNSMTTLGKMTDMSMLTSKEMLLLRVHEMMKINHVISMKTLMSLLVKYLRTKTVRKRMILSTLKMKK